MKKQNRKNFTPITRDNTIKSKEKQKIRKCYNCQKKAILPKTASSFQKTGISLGNLHASNK